MVFISAGHNPNGLRPDPGAIANGYHEANLASEFRNLVTEQLKKIGVSYVSDKDDERLGTYLERIKTGSGSVVLEFHFDAASNASASGTTALIEAESDRLDRAFAKELSDLTSTILGIPNRGVKSETQSHRGRLALMREEGIICLLELGFITNINDLNKYNSNKHKLAVEMAKVIKRYEDLL